MTPPARLGLAAGIVAAAVIAATWPAVALDRALLPSEAPMEACPSQGAGFARIPGTSTCIRVSGRVAAGMDAGPALAPATPPVAGRIAIDARGEAGGAPVRTFVRIGAGR